MENNDINNNNNGEVKPKRVYTKAQQKASKAYHERNKDNEEYKQRNRDKAKKAYEKNKEYIIARVRANQRRVPELKQLEKLNYMNKRTRFNNLWKNDIKR